MITDFNSFFLFDHQYKYMVTVSMHEQNIISIKTHVNSTAHEHIIILKAIKCMPYGTVQPMKRKQQMYIVLNDNIFDFCP